MTDDNPTTASEWIARMNAGSWSPELQTALENWLAGDSQRQADFTMARLVWSVADKLETSDEAHNALWALKNESARASRSHWIARLFGITANPFSGLTRKLAPAVIALVFVVVGIALFSDRAPPLNGAIPLHNGDSALTAIGEISSFVLPDGSKVTVNADSNVRVAFTKAQRQIFLERGQAFFEVQHNTKRPFVVVAGARTIVVTGTKFDVEHDSPRSSIQVAVVDGHVNVSDSHSEANGITALEANDVYLFPEQGPPARLALAAHKVSAWQSRRLYFEGKSVRDVLFSINRFAPKRLVLTDSRLAELPLSGAFTAGDTDAVLFALQTLYGIEATDGGDMLILNSSK